MAVVRGHSPGTVYATERGGTGQCFLPLRDCTNVHGGDAGEDVEGIPDDPTAPPAAEAGRVTTDETAEGAAESLGSM